jgi:hypothetical protein
VVACSQSYAEKASFKEREQIGAAERNFCQRPPDRQALSAKSEQSDKH